MSLQTGQRLATIGRPIINPHNLQIIAFYVNGPRLDFNPAVLFSEDIRELGSIGVIIDSSDTIMSPDGLVRLQEVLNYHFSLDGLRVIDTKGRKLGVIDSYALDSDDLSVQQIFVRPTLTKRMALAQLTINRKQIVEIDNQKITVDSADSKIANVAEKIVNPNEIPFENPFRQSPVPAPETKG